METNGAPEIGNASTSPSNSQNYSTTSPQPGWAENLASYGPTSDVAIDTGSASTSPKKKPDMGQMMDKCDDVFARMNDATSCAKQLSVFYQTLATIESLYSKSLFKLAQSTTFCASESLNDALNSLLLSTEAHANDHAQLANSLQETLATEMNELSMEMKKERSQTRTVWSDSHKALRNQTLAVEKCFQRYLQAVRDAEKELSLRNEKSYSNPKVSSKQEKKIQEALSKYKSRRDSYGEAVSVHGKLRAQYSKTCSYILANIEATDISRLHKVQASLECYHQNFREAINKNIPLVEKLHKSIESMDPLDDVVKFVESNRSAVQDKLPPAMEFIDICTDLEGELNSKLSIEDSFVPRTGDAGKSRSFGSDGSEHNSTAFPYSISAPIINGAVQQEQIGLNPALTNPHPDVFYRTIYKYSESQSDVLAFVVGEFIRLEEPMSEGWSLGCLNGTRGMFPTSYCQRFIPQKCEVVCDFSPSETTSDQLNMHAGDSIWILHISDPHWVWASNSDGRQGNFPLSYCTPAPLPVES